MKKENLLSAIYLAIGFIIVYATLSLSARNTATQYEEDVIEANSYLIIQTSAVEKAIINMTNRANYLYALDKINPRDTARAFILVMEEYNDMQSLVTEAKRELNNSIKRYRVFVNNPFSKLLLYTSGYNILDMTYYASAPAPVAKPPNQSISPSVPRDI